MSDWLPFLIVIFGPMPITHLVLRTFFSPYWYGTGWFLDLTEPGERLSLWVGTTFWPIALPVGLLAVALGTDSGYRYSRKEIREWRRKRKRFKAAMQLS